MKHESNDELFRVFLALPETKNFDEFQAILLSDSRLDFLAKGVDGEPVFLLHDTGLVKYQPAIRLKNLSVQYHCTCKVRYAEEMKVGQFAVIGCDSSVPELYEIFTSCLNVAASRLPQDTDTLELENLVRGILDLFRSLSQPSSRNLIGLWGELFLISSSKNIIDAINAWHCESYERFDFSWHGNCAEVKATLGELRVHNFSLQQLQSPTQGKGFVVSLLLQYQTGGVGVLDLVHTIEAALPMGLLREKLWRLVLEALGSDFARSLDRKFDISYARRNCVVFPMKDVPSLSIPTDLRISEVTFKVDLSCLGSSLADLDSGDVRNLFSQKSSD